MVIVDANEFAYAFSRTFDMHDVGLHVVRERQKKRVLQIHCISEMISKEEIVVRDVRA